MNIVFIISTLKSGGAERVVANLSNSLCEKGYKISIVVFDEGKSDYDILDNVSLISYKYNSNNKISTFFNGVRGVKKAISDINPDVVISFLSTINIYTIIGNLTIKKPLIISERNDPYSDPKQWYYRLLRKIFYSFSDGYVFQTEKAQLFFNSSIEKQSVIIQNPVFIKQEKYRKTYINKNIVSVGRLESQKNYKLLIDAFDIINKDFQDYTLTIYGEGIMRNEIESYIVKKNLEGKVNLPGRINDIHEKIKDSSLFVLSSNYEGMSNSLMEAMALGLPCISTDCPIGGSSDLIKNKKNGILVPVGNSDKMAEAMREILSNHELAKELGREAQKICESNSLDVITNQWEKYILKVYNKFR